MKLSAALVAFFLTFSVEGVAIRSPHNPVLHEKRHAPRTQWRKRDRVHGGIVLPVRIGLTQSNLDKGYDFLMDVADPASSNYGKHWTAEQVHETFAPTEEAVAAVRNWLIESGIQEDRIVHSDNKGWLAFDASTQEAEALFKTTYYNLEHSNSDKTAIACDEYHLPAHIQEHIDYVKPGLKPIRTSGVDRRGEPLDPHAQRSHLVVSPDYEPQLSDPVSDLSTCDVLITPACIRALYEVPPSLIPNAWFPGPSNALGIFEEGDYYDQDDLNLFFAKYAPAIPQGTAPTPNFIDGAEAPVPEASGGGESVLDLSISYPLLYPQKIILYQTDDYHYAVQDQTEGFYNTFLDAIDGSYCKHSAYGETGDSPTLDPAYPDPAPGGYKGELQCGVYKPTNVISTSYGEAEIDLPAYYMERQCNEFMKLGLQGHTFLFSSGDYGVGGAPGDASASGCLGPDNNVFNPQEPVSCPFVLGVGATKVYPGHSVFEPESAANDLAGQPYKTAYSSHGGFSNVYNVPAYQQNAINNFFANYDPPYKYYSGNASFGQNGGVYNRIGRGIPDVSANGDNIAVALHGNYSFEGGTSAATPIFASIINLINEQRLIFGKSPVGFINPALYSNPWLLNDITNGSNPNCHSDGFSAVPGWDPVTGLGTPNYPRMLAFFLSLP